MSGLIPRLTEYLLLLAEGVFSRLRAFYKDANNTDIIRKYALKTDDIWLMFMAVQNDTKIIRTYQYHRTFILSEQEQTVQLGKEAIYQGRYIKTFYDLAKAYPHAYQNMLSEIAE